MRRWHSERSWRQPDAGDLVYLIGSFGQRVGPPGLVTSVYGCSPSFMAQVFCVHRGFESHHETQDLEVVSESH